MKVTQRFSGISVGLLLASLATLCMADPPAQTMAAKIQVGGITGSCSFSVGGGAGIPLRAGMVVPVGAVIKTEARAAVDLSLSHNAGTVRLLQNSTLSVDKFTADNGSVEVQLFLMDGSMVGFDKKLSEGSRYQVKIPHGLTDISGSKYRISAQGYLVLLDGSAVLVFVPPTGDPAPFELKAASPVYFSPVEGIKPAPADLVREVVLQTKGKLR